MNSQLVLDGQIFLDVYDENNNLIQKIHKTNQITELGLNTFRNLLIQGLNCEYPYISDTNNKITSLLSNQYLNGGIAGQISFLQPLNINNLKL